MGRQQNNNKEKMNQEALNEDIEDNFYRFGKPGRKKRISIDWAEESRDKDDEDLSDTTYQFGIDNMPYPRQKESRDPLVTE